MTRTQIYLPDEDYKELQFLALTGEDSFSDLIREGAKHVIQKKKINKKDKKFNAVNDFGSLLKGGDKDLSSKIDYYLYVEPYKNK